jgi:hypothetical protein
VILIGVLGFCVILVVVALRTAPRGGGPRLYLAISALPLLIAAVLPAPFALARREPNDWAQQTVAIITGVGLSLSVILFTIGVGLTIRAARAGDRQAARLLALETALAGFPAGIVAVYAALLRFL